VEGISGRILGQADMCASKARSRLDPGEEIKGTFPVWLSLHGVYEPRSGVVVVTDRRTLVWERRVRLLLAGPLQRFPLVKTDRLSPLDLVGSKSEWLRVWVREENYLLVEAVQHSRKPGGLWAR
jgi:hypothetical protein